MTPTLLKRSPIIHPPGNWEVVAEYLFAHPGWNPQHDYDLPEFPHIQTALFDIETDGLLPSLTTIHCLVIHDFERRKTYRFRRNTFEDTLIVGLLLLQDADLLAGHNILHFDIPALRKIYPDFNPQGKQCDTLTMTRMVKADQKDKDFVLARIGKLPGALIGSHTLDAWGHRLGKHKGDYKKTMEARAKEQGITDPEEITRFVWGSWNSEMEDYCVVDVEVTTALWRTVKGAHWNPGSIQLEHTIHDLMGQQERNGIYFNVEDGEKLAYELSSEAERMSRTSIDHYGMWWVPKKKRIVKAPWDDPEGINKKKKYAEPRAEYGEDLSRAIWGEVTVPTKALKYKDVLRGDRNPDAPYCPVELKEFNPNSRQQIVDRFQTVYAWNPVDFTETGQPEVSDTVLRTLIGHIPMAEELAEIFYYKKRLGQVQSGKNAWLTKVTDEGKIHHYCNVGGTISGRASHVGPNLGQVPAVMVKEEKLPDGTKEKRILMGREGDHGWDCRRLFGLSQARIDLGWKMVGTDLSGIELRCLGEKLARWDNGAYLDLVLDGDIHSYNQQLAELPTRASAKTFIYACVPMDSLALTRDGWKGYNELQVGEPILTYNSGKNCKEWKPVLEKVKYADAEVIELTGGQTFSVRCTPNHRWFTRRRSGRHTRFWVNEVATAEDLTTEHNIIVNAPMCDDSSGFDSSQLHAAKKYGTDWVKQILSLSPPERRAWLTGFCVADGYWMANDTWSWCQNKGSISEAAIIASYLSWDGRLILNDRVGTKHPMHVGRQVVRNYVTCQKLQKIVQPRQDVWCVRTENESWIMRQGNTITITGNTVYGAGDVKLGSIVEPLAPEEEQRIIGAKLRARFMDNLPAFKMLMKWIKLQAEIGYLPGLDGRRLFVRSPHSALNTLLQSDAALIAKKWVCLTEDYLLDSGYEHSWDGDFVFLLWIHDEIQNGARTQELAELVRDTSIRAAADAGKFFGYHCPIDAEGRIGTDWAMTH